MSDSVNTVAAALPATATSERLTRRLAVWLSGKVVAAGYMRKWLLLGAIIGVVGGLGAVVFMESLRLATHLLLVTLGGYTPPLPLNEGNVVGSSHFTRPWAVPLVAGLGGLASGVLVARFAPEAAGHGTDAAIAAVHRNPTGVRARASVVKIVASALTIGSGGSGGREGPTAQISAGFASFLARALRLQPSDARIAVTIGIGSGIGAIFRTPLGGAVLGAEILYREDIETAALVPGLIASTVAFVVYGSIEGFAPIFGYHDAFRFDQPVQLVYYALIGLAAAPIALLYSKSFYSMQRFVRWLPISRALAPAVAGLLVGTLGLVFPQALGTGYGWVQQTMTQSIYSFPVWLIVLLPLVKILATDLSIGSGGSGGIFGPGMVIGAFTGAAVWRLLELVAPGVPVSPAPFVIVGMMACFGSIGHIPFATMLMVSEMTGNLSLLPAAMVAVGIATLITRDQHIYSAQLRSRADSPAHRFRYPLTPLGTLPLSAATVPPPVKLRITDVAAAVRERVAAAPLHAAPVVDEQGFLVGTLTAESLRAAADDATIASLTDRTAPTATVDFTLEAGMELLAMSQSPWAPVVGSDRRLAGIVTAQGLLRRYRSALRSSMRRLEVLSGSPVVEARIPAGSPLAGKTVADVPLPADTVIVTVQRGPQALFATAATALAEDDLLTIFSRSSTGSGLHLPGVEVLAPRSEGEPVVAT